MSTPQPGIVPEATAHASFLVLDAVRAKRVGEALTTAQSAASEVASLDPAAGLKLTVGLGAAFWDRLGRGARPRELRPLRSFGAGDKATTATAGDVFLHVASTRRDLNFELTRRLMDGLSGAVELQEEVAGFRYLDTRDLTGFIDGTENPQGDERAEVALIGEQDPDFAGGSYVLAMRFVHDLPAWNRLEVSEQEGAVGRTKPDSVELGDKPATAHISRVVIEEDGEELEIVRHSYPYGTTSEHGLYFVAYTAELSRVEKMLVRMYGEDPDGLSDRLMDFTRPVSGGAFFVPSMELLAELG